MNLVRGDRLRVHLTDDRKGPYTKEVTFERLGYENVFLGRMYVCRSADGSLCEYIESELTKLSKNNV